MYFDLYGTKSSVGETLYANQNEIAPNDAVRAWYAKSAYYDITTNKCTDFCEYYNQVT